MHSLFVFLVWNLLAKSKHESNKKATFWLCTFVSCEANSFIQCQNAVNSRIDGNIFRRKTSILIRCRVDSPNTVFLRQMHLIVALKNVSAQSDLCTNRASGRHRSLELHSFGEVLKTFTAYRYLLYMIIYTKYICSYIHKIYAFCTHFLYILYTKCMKILYTFCMHFVYTKYTKCIQYVSIYKIYNKMD